MSNLLMPKEESDCKKHKILAGIGIIIFSLVLWITSSEAAVAANLNWPGAFFILGVLMIIKALFFSHSKK
jgi:hypothetical protein